MEDNSSNSHTHMSSHVHLKSRKTYQVVDIDKDHTQDFVEDSLTEKTIFLDTVGRDSKEPDDLDIDTKEEDGLSEDSVGYFLGSWPFFPVLFIPKNGLRKIHFVKVSEVPMVIVVSISPHLEREMHINSEDSTNKSIEFRSLEEIEMGSVVELDKEPNHVQTM